MSVPTSVYRVQLGTGKVVLLREVKIKHMELAAQAVGSKSGGDATVASMLMQKELLKQLIVSINDQTPSATALEDMDSLFSFIEYTQLLSVIGQLTGGSEGASAPQIEVVPSGAK